MNATTKDYDPWAYVAVYTCDGMIGWAVFSPEHPNRYAKWAARRVRMPGIRVFFENDAGIKARAICRCGPGGMAVGE